MVKQGKQCRLGLAFSLSENSVPREGPSCLAGTAPPPCPPYSSLKCRGASESGLLRTVKCQECPQAGMLLAWGGQYANGRDERVPPGPERLFASTAWSHGRAQRFLWFWTCPLCPRGKARRSSKGTWPGLFGFSSASPLPSFPKSVELGLHQSMLAARRKTWTLHAKSSH